MPSEWLLPGALIALSALIAVGQAYLVARKTPYSVIPLLGGLLGAAGFLLAPSPLLNRLWWAPLILDVGSIPLAATTAYHWLKRR